MARVLAPGGRVAIAVWDRLEHMPAYAEEVAILYRLAGTRAGDALRAPFSLGDTLGPGRALRRVGLRDVEIETEPFTASFPSIRFVVEADLRGWLPVMGVELPEEKIAEILVDAERDAGPLRRRGSVD